MSAAAGHKETDNAPLFFWLTAALLLASSTVAYAGSGRQSEICGKIPKMEPQITCWEQLYVGLEVHRLTDDELRRLMSRTPDSGTLKLATQGAWLHHPHHGVIVWIVAADEDGNVLNAGKATKRALDFLIREAPHPEQ